jgi:hypothetical protein
MKLDLTSARLAPGDPCHFIVNESRRRTSARIERD